MNNIQRIISGVVTVLVNYKGAKYTAASIDSLMSSDIPTSIVVVDNSPNDPELESLKKKYSDVKFISAPENLGFGRGNNMGIDWALKHTKAEFIFIFNNDATVKGDTISKLEKAMVEHPEAAVVSPRIVFAEEPGKLWYGGGEVDWKRGRGRVLGTFGPADTDLAMTSRYVSFSTGCAMFIRRSVLEEQKGFDSRFFMYEEDLELSLRIQESGWKLWYESSALVLHIGQGSQENRDKFIPRFSSKNPNLSFLVYHGVKNSLLNMHMHARGRDRVTFNLRFPFFLLVKGTNWLVHGRFDALKAVFCAIRDYMRVR